MTRVQSFQRSALALMLALALAACDEWITPVHPVDPVDPIDPITPGEQFIQGAWTGSLTSDDGFTVTVHLALVEEDSIVTGSATFPEEPITTTGFVEGTSIENEVALTITTTVNQEQSVITLDGTATEDDFTGTFAGLIGTSGTFTFGRIPTFTLGGER